MRTNPFIWLTLLLTALLTLGCGKLAAEEAKKPPAPKTDMELTEAGGESRTAVLAGGCFWCVEAVFENVKGVEDVISGYAGGDEEAAKYQMVARGQTDHAESVKITYDPSQMTYGKLLQIFMATHDPTQFNRQGPDVGRQYRSAIFYRDEDRRQIAEQYIVQLEAADVYDEPIVTRLEELAGFYPAEDYHQDYVQKNPDDGYVRRYVPPKLKKLRRFFPELAESGAKLKD